MKKYIALLLIVVLSQLSSAQNYCTYLPYFSNNLYGLVSDKQEQIVEPKYKEAEIINEFSFVIFDKIHCYDLFNGKYVNIPYSKENSFVVISNELFVFNSKGNTLINPYTKEKIPLKLKYKFMYNKTFYDFKSKKSYDLIFALTNDEKQLFFKNNKTLSQAIIGKYNFENFDIIQCNVDNFEQNIGLLILNSDKSFSCYNYDGTKSFKISTSEIEKTTTYAIEFKKSVHQKFVDFFGFESNFFPESFSLSDLVGASSGKFFNRLIDNIQLGNGYTLKINNYNYDLNSPNKTYFKDTKYDNIYHFNYSENQYYLKFTKKSTTDELHFFVNHPKINPTVLMCPKEELIKFELMK
jgi:hypothetical protein